MSTPSKRKPRTSSSLSFPQRTIAPFASQLPPSQTSRCSDYARAANCMGSSDRQFSHERRPWRAWDDWRRRIWHCHWLWCCSSSGGVARDSLPLLGLLSQPATGGGKCVRGRFVKGDCHSETTYLRSQERKATKRQRNMSSIDWKTGGGEGQQDAAASRRSDDHRTSNQASSSSS